MRGGVELFKFNCDRLKMAEGSLPDFDIVDNNHNNHSVHAATISTPISIRPPIRLSTASNSVAQNRTYSFSQFIENSEDSNINQLFDENQAPQAIRPNITVTRSKSVADISSVSSSIPSTPSGVSNKKNFQVVVRIRPRIGREIDNSSNYKDCTKVSNSNKTITVNESAIVESFQQSNPHLTLNANIQSLDLATHTFNFDYIYDQHSNQQFVYENTAKHAVLSVLSGYNATCLAYGQTGTGYIKQVSSILRSIP
jgi:hypothetical protein